VRSASGDLKCASYLLYGCPFGDFRQVREGGNCGIDNGFDFVLVTQWSADLHNEERSCRITNTVAANCLGYLQVRSQGVGKPGPNGYMYVIARVECPQDFRMDSLRSQTLLALGQQSVVDRGLQMQNARNLRRGSHLTERKLHAA
jgi:hypothetical protein